MSYQLMWFKSSYSDEEGDNCVEVSLPWRKSSYSDGDGSECVEIAGGGRGIYIRDSKRISSPYLAVGVPAWAGFLTYIAAV
ncbi:DUF397 domain-containing protein [Streptomyces nondiastaticus]|uniref:DUF397 domain-containing protein n=1 Tax=Streptomyces nondiastaticus TaxID=3154512 RepID=A0ABW6TVY3_9ACTN